MVYELEEEGSYDTAQVCLNGHVITRLASYSPEVLSDYCTKCGQPTIMQCQKCNAPIRGAHSSEMGINEPPPPSYCHNCGNPYPWTETRLSAAKELTDEAENLSKEEKEQLKSTFDDLVKETPKTPVAISKYKRLTQQAGSFVAEGLQKILLEVMVAYAKKELHLP